MAKADPHRAFVTAWREWGERWLLTDSQLVGPDDAWFKVCKSTRFWDDASLPPERPGRRLDVPIAPKYKPPKRKRARPTVVTVRVLTGIGRDLVEWFGPEDHALPARHRDREAEFHERMERELRELEGRDPWLTAA